MRVVTALGGGLLIPAGSRHRVASPRDRPPQCAGAGRRGVDWAVVALQPEQAVVVQPLTGGHWPSCWPGCVGGQPRRWSPARPSTHTWLQHLPGPRSGEPRGQGMAWELLARQQWHSILI